MVIEIIQVQPEGSVPLYVDQMGSYLVGENGLSVRREPHQLVLATVDLEAAVVRERAIQKPEGMRISDLLEDLHALAAADAEAGCSPFAHAIHAKNCRLAEGRWIEGRRGVGVVMARIKHGDIARQHLLDLLPEIRLDPEKRFYRPDKVLFGFRGERNRGADDPVCSQRRIVIKRDGGEFVAIDLGLLQAIVDCIARKSWIMLAAAEPFLLRGGHDPSIFQEGGGRVVIVGRNTQHVPCHQNFSSTGAITLASDSPITLCASGVKWQSVRNLNDRRTSAG